MMNIMHKLDGLLDRHRKLTLFLIVIVGFLLTYSRKPDLLTNAQFWAEDATIWYTDAYNNSLLSVILRPYPDVVTIGPRIIASLAVALVPLAKAPLLFNISAMCFQMLPLIIIMGGRLKKIIRSNLLAVLVCFIYIGFLNCTEIIGDVANLQWTLGITAFLVLISGPSRRLAWKIFDIAILVLAGLDGPNALLLLPVAIILWWRTKDELGRFYSAISKERTHAEHQAGANRLKLIAIRFKFSLLSMANSPGFATIVLGLLAALQLLMTFVISHYHRIGAHPNADFLGFAKIIVGQIFVGGVLSDKYTNILYNNHSLLYAALVAGLALLLYCAIKGPLWLKVFILFGTLTMAIVLATIKATPLYDVWAALSMPTVGKRYWFFAICAWVASILWLSFDAKNKFMKALGIIMLGALMIIGLPQGWRLPKSPDNDFAGHVRQFEALPKGTTYRFPINPGWYFDLTKK